MTAGVGSDVVPVSAPVEAVCEKPLWTVQATTRRVVAKRTFAMPFTDPPSYKHLSSIPTPSSIMMTAAPARSSFFSKAISHYTPFLIDLKLVGPAVAAPEAWRATNFPYPLRPTMSRRLLRTGEQLEDQS